MGIGVLVIFRVLRAGNRVVLLRLVQPYRISGLMKSYATMRSIIGMNGADQIRAVPTVTCLFILFFIPTVTYPHEETNSMPYNARYWFAPISIGTSADPMNREGMMPNKNHRQCSFSSLSAWVSMLAFISFAERRGWARL